MRQHLKGRQKSEKTKPAVNLRYNDAETMRCVAVASTKCDNLLGSKRFSLGCISGQREQLTDPDSGLQPHQIPPDRL